MTTATEMNETEKQLRETCRAYSRDLDAIAAGELWVDADGNEKHAKRKPRGDGWEQQTAWGYFEKNGLGDVTFEISARATLRGGKILMGFGGPNIYIEEDAVRGYWGTDKACFLLSDEARDLVWEYLAEAAEITFGMPFDY